jgi:phytanoyl-CoA hydroxylase
VTASLTPQQWQQYERDGYLRLGKVLNATEHAALCQRIDDIMLGKTKLDYDRIMMQLDSESGKYEDAGAQTKGFKGPTLNYRKMQDLEYDPLFLSYMQRPIFEDICDRVYGPDTPISCFRAMFMNKPSRRGTVLPWHQDRWVHLDRDPLITLWTALDPATKANGCVKIIPASHKLGVINPSHGSGFLTEQQALEICKQDKVEYLELEAGEVALLHNWLLHSSDVNTTERSRRAFSVCYMDARTRASNGETYNTVFGEGAMRPEELEAAAAR